MLCHILQLSLKSTYRVAMMDEGTRSSSVPEPVVRNSTPKQFPSTRVRQHVDAKLDRLY